MKKFSIVLFLLVFSGLVLFAQPSEQEEVDYLLFLPNSGDGFVNEEQARLQLDKTARYLKGRDLVPGQVIVYGYAAYSLVDVDPMDISKQRALFVINELQKRGIARNLFADPVAHGSVYLWGSNTTEENREPNRRVRILIDGTLITPEVIAAPNIADSMLDDKIVIEETELTPPVKIEPKPSVKKEKSDFDFPWWLLLLLLLIPLLFLLLRALKNRKKEEKPVVKKAAPSVAPPKPEPVPQQVEPTPAQAPAPASTPEPQPVVPAPEPAPIPEPVVREPEPVPVVAAPIAPHIETYEDVVDLEEEIRRRAYFHSQGHDYCDMDGDWFVAIPRVRVEFEEKGYETYMDNGTWWAKKTIVKKV